MRITDTYSHKDMANSDHFWKRAVGTYLYNLAGALIVGGFIFVVYAIFMIIKVFFSL